MLKKTSNAQNAKESPSNNNKH